MEYYTFTPKDQKLKKIMAKAANLMTEEEVKDEIIKQSGFHANKVQCTKLRRKSEESYSFLVNIPKNTRSMMSIKFPSPTT